MSGGAVAAVAAAASDAFPQPQVAVRPSHHAAPLAHSRWMQAVEPYPRKRHRLRAVRQVCSFARIQLSSVAKGSDRVFSMLVALFPLISCLLQLIAQSELELILS